MHAGAIAPRPPPDSVRVYRHQSRSFSPLSAGPSGNVGVILSQGLIQVNFKMTQSFQNRSYRANRSYSPAHAFPHAFSPKGRTPARPPPRMPAPFLRRVEPGSRPGSRRCPASSRESAPSPFQASHARRNGIAFFLTQSAFGLPSRQLRDFTDKDAKDRILQMFF